MFEPVFELLIGIVIAVVFFFAGVFFSRKIAEKEEQIGRAHV